ncbi:raffinose/stachyose/melibiose transport system permease protein [Paenibacillus sp. UNCCL117]|uniref:carbohydrate ABC transporter permease n=1 Tax=unclassified Paenibacillus TaxID=185978 RepID=UPI00088E27E1|nr:MULTISPECIES: carbohydrate ABC transporter permease [unclassified Paenibacillus]SDE56200.1 carbohydrate ABC transporter membrane protein 2, CUT1 family [Paenibacillus sp. cl123]SFW66238.1 raffinose/stachyose/melibiose transport system permease protein [Paenibacillus sp. UNCCL117]
MHTEKYTPRMLAAELLLIVVALLFLAPFYFVVVNSLKSFAELLVNAASLPTTLVWENFAHAWKVLRFADTLTNTVIITAAGDIGLVLIASMAAYRLVRKPSRTHRALLTLFIAAMVIPFQAIMIPLVKVASWLHLVNSIPGVVICYFGLGVSFSIFLYQGFVRSIPLEIEESATVDGCTPYGVFWRIVFPLLKPMTVTIVLLNSLWMWNDFLLALIILQDKQLHTIQIAINSLFGEYTNQWDLALAALVMSMVPLLVFFLALQKHIIEGITAGAIKG